MNDVQQDSRSAPKRARLADVALIAALLLVLAISWQDSTTGSPDLHQAARQAVAQHVGKSSIEDMRNHPQFIEPTALHARTAD